METYNALVVAIHRDDVLPMVLAQIETIRPKIELVIAIVSSQLDLSR